MSGSTPSRATLFRRRQADRIESSGVFAMVRCSYCALRNLGCKLSSLHKKCGNCVRFGNPKCEPESVPLPDYSKIDKEMSRLEKLEDEEEARLRVEEDVAEAALLRARQAREKLASLRKQKKLLRRKEQKLFDSGMATVDELEALEAREELASAAAAVNPEAPLGAEVIDWSVLWSDDASAS
jgi:hypothetical protein